MHRLRTHAALFVAGVALTVNTAAWADAGAKKRAPRATHATVLHVPYSDATSEQPLTLIAVVDDAWTETGLVVRYRQLRSPGGFREVPFERSSAGGYFATIPASDMWRPGIVYYIAGRAQDGTERLHFASPESPQVVRVQQSPDERWKDAERARLRGYLSTMSVTLEGQNFGNRFPGNRDYYVRGEIDWTHRLLGPRLYAVSLGYGFIDGKTPSSDQFNAVVLDQGARYGYAGVQLRLRESISFRGRVFLGVSKDEFIVGTRAEVTLGKFFQSSVDLGAELLQDLGPSVWIRLQWDTVTPFIMGAAIVKTDLPEATLSGGTYIRWDVTYPITPRIRIRGDLSFGSRDGPGRFGGGLGTSLAF